MEYTRDLLKVKKKSKFPLFLGIASFAIAIIWIWMKLIYNERIETFDWFYSIVFLLNGVSHTSTGLGYSIERIFGKAFIQIDDQVIYVKTGVLDKGQKVYWSEIQSIDYKPNKFTITKKDDSTSTIELTKLEYSVIQETKDAIETRANDSNVPSHLG